MVSVLETALFLRVNGMTAFVFNVIILYVGGMSLSPERTFIKSFLLGKHGVVVGSEPSPESAYWFESHLCETRWD